MLGRSHHNRQSNLEGHGSPALVETSIESLILGTAAREPDAFSALYESMYAPVSRVTQSLLNNATLAEDVTQDVFLTVWKVAPQFDPGRGSAQAWIIGIARFTAIDRMRAIQSTRQRDQRYFSQLDTAVELPADDVVIGRLDRVVVHEALAVLTPIQRQSVVLAFLGGLPYPEVARVLGVPLPTVKARIRDGLARLRRYLEDRDVRSITADGQRLSMPLGPPSPS